MVASKLQPIPEPTLRRLPLYYAELQRLRQAGRPVVSATALGHDLQVDPTLVRKDLEVTGVVGRPKTGYWVEQLLEGIEDLLGWNDVRSAVLVGAGSLGSALLGYPRFRERGLDLVAAFDSDPAKIGREIHGKPVFAMDRIDDLVPRMHLLIGVIAVPAEAAQAVAERLVQAGIEGLWNFSPTRLRLPESVVVQQEDIYSGLAVLTRRLADRRRPGSAEALEAPTASSPAGTHEAQDTSPRPRDAPPPG